VLFHNARQVETDRQQLFMRKQRLGRQQSQLEPQLEETARIPAPWDREEQEETEEQEARFSSNLDRQAEEREGRLSPNLGRQVEEREGGVSSRSGRQERTENVDQEDEQGASSVDETARKGKTVFLHCSIVPDPSCFVTDFKERTRTTELRIRIQLRLPDLDPEPTLLF
jgi:hypothetical protein